MVEVCHCAVWEACCTLHAWLLACVHASDCAPLLLCRHCALQGASMSGLQQWAASSKQSQRATADKQSWAWVVQGGCAALPATQGTPQHSGPRVHAGNKTSSSSSYATLYCTGHSDGAVRLWDMHGPVPQLLGSVPSSAAAHALSSIRKTRAAAVCTLEFAWEQGLLISGHEGGEVRHMRPMRLVVEAPAYCLNAYAAPILLPCSLRHSNTHTAAGRLFGWGDTSTLLLPTAHATLYTAYMTAGI